MAGTLPESVRPIFEEFARRAKENLQPYIEDVARRATAEVMLKDAEAVAELQTKVKAAIATEFWSNPANMSSRLAPGTDIAPVFDAMTAAAVAVFSEFLRNPPRPVAPGDGSAQPAT